MFTSECAFHLEGQNSTKTQTGPECSPRRRQWFVFDRELVLPEYIIYFEYITTKVIHSWVSLVFDMIGLSYLLLFFLFVTPKGISSYCYYYDKYIKINPFSCVPLQGSLVIKICVIMDFTYIKI